jgi:hypothetical protein
MIPSRAAEKRKKLFQAQGSVKVMYHAKYYFIYLSKLPARNFVLLCRLWRRRGVK